MVGVKFTSNRKEIPSTVWRLLLRLLGGEGLDLTKAGGVHKLDVEEGGLLVWEERTVNGGKDTKNVGRRGQTTSAGLGWSAVPRV